MSDVIDKIAGRVGPKVVALPVAEVKKTDQEQFDAEWPAFQERILNKAKIVRFYYAALRNEGFAHDDAMDVTIQEYCHE